MTKKSFDQPKPGEIIEENVSFEDFCVRYEGQYVEWQGGKVIAKLSNNEEHQFILNLLQTILNLYLMFTQKGRLYSDGYQMRLVESDPARQPDLLIVFEENYKRLKQQYLDGPADIVIEIISPGTGHVDRGDKYYEYQKGGVREYWIIDPESKRVDIYHLDEDGHYQPVQGNGEIISKLLDSFTLDTAILWQEELPKGREIVQLVESMVKQV